MPRKLIKTLLLRSDQGGKQLTLPPWIGRWPNKSNLLHVNKHSVSSAVFVGFFCAALPLPGQMVLAAALALMFRANLPFSMLCTFISNPLTFVPLYSGVYFIGLWLLGIPSPFPKGELNVNHLLENMDLVWKPMLTGALMFGLCAGISGYLAMRLFWRIVVVRGWRLRQKIRDAKNKITPS